MSFNATARVMVTRLLALFMEVPGPTQLKFARAKGPIAVGTADSGPIGVG